VVTRILVTGARGFIGQHLLRIGAARGLTVCGWTRADADLTTADLSALLSRLKPQVIINAAGYGVAHEERDPQRLFAVNVAAVVRLIAAAHETGVARLIQLGTYSEYGDHAGVITEDTPLQPKESYAATKAAASLLAGAPGMVAPMESIVLRLFNVFGPGERAQRLLPQVIRHCRTGARLPLTPGTQVKEWAFVGDVAHWIFDIALLPAPWTYRMVNLGSGQRLSVRDMALAAARLMKGEHLLDFGAVPIPEKEVQTGPCNLARVSEMLPDRVMTPLPQAVALTVKAG